ncbi:MAG: hypothetical protein WCI46_09515 [Verrucomicrobiota bacterium]
MIVITFALPQESRELRRALQPLHPFGPPSLDLQIGSASGLPIVLAQTGVGPIATTHAISTLLAFQKPQLLISTGFAGGLNPKLASGDLLLATNFTTPTLLENTRTLLRHEPQLHFGSLLSQSLPAESLAEKSALATTTGASAVDMETASIYRACLDADVPMISLRAISDSAQVPLPVPFAKWFDLQTQRPKPLALLQFLTLHPSKISPFFHFIRGLSPARQSFTRAVLRLLPAPTPHIRSAKSSPSSPSSPD